MSKQTNKLFRSYLTDSLKAKNGSIAINDKAIIEAFKANPDNTFLVSFPRTGSHWLRMLMELYFGRPSLVRIFYYPKRKDYLTLHTHDLDLEVERTNVIYLYRDPIDTLYSQLRYHKEDINDRRRIAYWAELYGLHMAKWLHTETCTSKKTIIKYEELKMNMLEEFAKICVYFNSSCDIDRLKAAADTVSKREVKNKTPHDFQVINLTESYDTERQYFHAEHSELIWEVLLRGREYLRQDF